MIAKQGPQRCHADNHRDKKKTAPITTIPTGFFSIDRDVMNSEAMGLGGSYGFMESDHVFDTTETLAYSNSRGVKREENF